MTPARPVVVVHDPIRDARWTYEPEVRLLAEAGVAFVVPADDQEARRLERTADIVVVNAPPFGAAEMAPLERCVGLIAYSVGMDMIDLEAAADVGLPVRNIAGYCTDEVSDHAMALVLAAERRLAFFGGAGSRGDWNVYATAEFTGLRRLRGRTLGLIGAGRIGREVARKARVFGYRTIAVDPAHATSPDPGLEIGARAEVLAVSDVVVVCASLTPSSRPIVDAAAFAAMRPGVTFVNVARGGLVDETALIDALRSGRVGYAALDVRTAEPPGEDDPIRRFPNVLLTQHVAFASIESDDDLRRGCVSAALALLEAGGRIAVGAGPVDQSLGVADR